ncbi:MAG: hypothetical protein K6F21_08065, partial [Bacteroidales bacterium]|nr:hypothetical protein [Bacteroidales bacterium]
MKRIALFLSLTIFAVFAAPANAQEAASSEALPFLRYERNPARAAMAGAGSALLVGGSATSAFGSPFAAAASANKVEAAASYANWAPSLNSSNNIMAGASVKLGKSLAVSAAFASDKLSEISVNGDKFSPSNTIFAGAVSLALGQSFSLGAAINLAKSQLLSDYSVSGTAFDLMLCYRKDAFGVAGGVRSLGGKVGNASLPTSFNVSGGYGLPVGPVALKMAADADYYFSGNWSAAAG